MQGSCPRETRAAAVQAKAEKQRKGKPSKVAVAHYDYIDEQGVLLYQVVRFEPKTFPQRRPDGAAGGVGSWATFAACSTNCPS